MSLNRSKKRKADPTGQSSRRRNATKSIDVRLNRAERKVKTLFWDIPRARHSVAPIANQSTIVYDYDLNATELAALEVEIRAILNNELETNSLTVPPDWFWSDQLEPPFRQGTMEEVNRVNQLIAIGIVAGLITDPFVQQVTIEQVMQSQAYRQPLNKIVVQNYSTFKSLSSRTSAQVIQQINQGISAGLTPRDIARTIKERFDVSHSNAKRIADTEINRAYNDAKMNAAKLIESQTGQKTGVLHISALLPQTRDTHADRHGKAYTIADQEKWWNTGVNRINCKCSTSVVLIDKGGEVVQIEDQQTLIDERKFFEKEYFGFENS